MGANKAKGTKMESDVRNYLRDLDYDVESLRTTGTLDEGDLIVREEDLYCLIEAKNVKRIDLASFIDQAMAERENFAKARGLDVNDILPVAIVKRRGRNVSQAYVVTTVEEFFR